MCYFSDHFAECYEKIGQISRLYCAAVRASPAGHGDMQELLQLLCRSLACLCRGATDGPNQSPAALHGIVQIILDVCSIEVDFSGHQVHCSDAEI